MVHRQSQHSTTHGASPKQRGVCHSGKQSAHKDQKKDCSQEGPAPSQHRRCPLRQPGAAGTPDSCTADKEWLEWTLQRWRGHITKDITRGTNSFLISRQVYLNWSLQTPPVSQHRVHSVSKGSLSPQIKITLEADGDWPADF